MLKSVVKFFVEAKFNAVPVSSSITHPTFLHCFLVSLAWVIQGQLCSHDKADMSPY